MREATTADFERRQTLANVEPPTGDSPVSHEDPVEPRERPTSPS
jgi:hypothetical protein